MTAHIPKPTISRLCRIYSLLEELEEKAETSISSQAIGSQIGAESHSVRKDVSYLGEAGTVGSGYDVAKLKVHIGNRLGLNRDRKACVVGLGKLGMAILQQKKILPNNFKIVAGFDSNINKLETIKIDIPVYPTYEMPEVIKKNAIELAVVTVPGYAAREIADRLIESGIKGMVNFSSAILSSDKNRVFICNIDLAGELRILSALFTLEQD